LVMAAVVAVAAFSRLPLIAMRGRLSLFLLALGVIPPTALTHPLAAPQHLAAVAAQLTQQQEIPAGPAVAGQARGQQRRRLALRELLDKALRVETVLSALLIPLVAAAVQVKQAAMVLAVFLAAAALALRPVSKVLPPITVAAVLAWRAVGGLLHLPV
jgi:hypothetical protein